MAKEGKKLELYEILAAKRAKGKMPLALDAKVPPPEEEPPPPPAPVPEKPRSLGYEKPEVPETREKMIIVDDALDGTAVDEGYPSYLPPQPEYQQTAPVRQNKAFQRAAQVAPPPQAAVAPPLQPPPPPPEPRVRAPREVVLALDTAFIVFVIVLALAGSSYFLGYKRGQEERPAGLVGLGDIDSANPDSINLRHLSPPARAGVAPPEQDYTLVLRTEPAADNLPERLEYELAEAMARGGREAGLDLQGFIFRNTKGNDTRFVLAVGLAKTPNDPELQKLLQIFNKMEGISLSRESRPYIGCQIAPIRELGVPVD